MSKPEKMKPGDRLGELMDFFDGYDTAVYTCEDDGYDYLENGEYCVETDNPHGEDHLIIDIYRDESTLWYGDWSAQYQNTPKGMLHMKEDIGAFLDGRMYIAVVTEGDAWVCSITVGSGRVEKGALIRRISEYLKSAGVEEWVKRIRADGAEITCLWWDEDRNDHFRIRPGEMA